MASAPPAAAVEPMNYEQAEVFSLEDDVNSLGIDYLTLIDDIRGWIEITTDPDGVLDSMSTYLINSFQILLTGSIHANLTTSDILKIKKMLKLKLKPALNKMLEMKTAPDNAKYTSFCSTFFGEMSGIEARGILEVLDPDPQCDAIVPAKNFCWICGNPLLWESAKEEAKPQCEHILPISDALFHLNLYQNRSSISTLGKYDLGILKLEYLWAHACCNLSKQHLKYITTDAKGKYVVYDNGIEETIARIKRNFGTYDCRAIFQREGDGPKYKRLTLQRIRKYIEPIVKTINNHIAYIEGIGTGINKQKGYIVYEYLIMIRFFSRIPNNTLVKAFKKYYLEGDPEFEAEKIRLADERIRAEEAAAKERAAARMARELAALARQQERAQKEQKKRNEEAAKKAAYGTRESRAAARAAAQAKMTEIKSAVGELQGPIISTANEDTAFLEQITTVEEASFARTEGGAKGKYTQAQLDQMTHDFIHRFSTRNREAQRVARNERAMRRERIRGIWLETGIKAVAELGHDMFSELDLHRIHQLDAMSELENMHQYMDFENAKIIEAELAKLRGIEYDIGMEEAGASAQGGARLKGGENKNMDDPYAVIQNDFTTEKAFVFLLAYQPVYLQLKGLSSIDAEQYMSTPHILRDTLAYFGIDPTEYHTLLMNDSHGASISIPRSRHMVSKKAEPQNFTSFYASLKNPRPITLSKPIIPYEAPLRQGIVSAGKRRTKKRNVIKRRTRKHRKI
jgi:hypothetical protein